MSSPGISRIGGVLDHSEASLLSPDVERKYKNPFVGESVCFEFLLWFLSIFEPLKAAPCRD